MATTDTETTGTQPTEAQAAHVQPAHVQPADVQPTDAQPTDAQPRGELSLRMVAMPADTNANGDIFGGWIMSLMDLAAGTAAAARARGRTATAAVSHLSFLLPVKVGDVVCVYTEVIRVGRTSMSLAVEAWALPRGLGERHKVTAAEFVMVAVDAAGKPRPVPPA
jgi:acyl-CoA thioesterase YciA